MVLPLEASSGQTPQSLAKVSVVADGAQQGGCGVWAHTVEGAQSWCGGGGDGVDVAFEPRGFGI
jgi:hypothetical protein